MRERATNRLFDCRPWLVGASLRLHVVSRGMIVTVRARLYLLTVSGQGDDITVIERPKARHHLIVQLERRIRTCQDRVL